MILQLFVVQCNTVAHLLTLESCYRFIAFSEFQLSFRIMIDSFFNYIKINLLLEHEHAT